MTDFDIYWQACNGPKLEAEHRFCERRWRFDFAHPATCVAIEIEGGAWIGGRHTRGAGFVKDLEKYNEAAFAGWTVFRLTPQQITVPMLERIARFISARTMDGGAA